MKKYTKLFFDFDDTLIDFKAAEKVALPTVFKEYSFPLTAEVEEYYKTLNHSLWQALERNEITRDELMTRRFGETMKHFGMEVDGRKMDERFRELLADTVVLVDGAQKVLNELSSRYDLFVVTNGMKTTQYQRIEAANLTHYFKRIFVSEETGYQKPQKEFFHFVFKNIPNFSIEDSLIIGDSFSADIVGGHQVGMDTCWFNPNSQNINATFTPTYTIKQLTELLRIVE